MKTNNIFVCLNSWDVFVPDVRARGCTHVSKCPVFVAGALIWPTWFYTARGRCAMCIKQFNTVLTLAFASTTYHIGAVQKSSPPPSKRTRRAFELKKSELQRWSRYTHISNYNAWYSMQGWIRLPSRVTVWTPKAEPAS